MCRPSRLLGVTVSGVLAIASTECAAQEDRSTDPKAASIPPPTVFRDAFDRIEAGKDERGDQDQNLTDFPVSSLDELNRILQRVFGRSVSAPSNLTEGAASAYLQMLRRYANSLVPVEGIWFPTPIQEFVYGGSPVSPTNPEFGTWQAEYAACVAVATTEISCHDWTDACWCCSGVLVSPNVVLIADHCFDADCLYRGAASGNTRRLQFAVYLGPGGGKPGRVVSVRRFERYDPLDGRDVDLAALILDEGVTSYHNGVAEIDVVYPRLATTAEINAAESVVIAGFGITEDGVVGERNVGAVQVVRDACAHPSTAEDYGCYGPYELVGTSFLGDLPPQTVVDTCRGDSGGPAFVSGGREGGRLMLALAGIASRGVAESEKGPECGLGGIYVRLDDQKVREWIDNLVKTYSPAQEN